MVTTHFLPFVVLAFLAALSVPTAGIYIPRRCAHSPCEIAKLSDIEGAGRLLAALLGSLSGTELRDLGTSQPL